MTKVKLRLEFAGFFALDDAQRQTKYRTGGPDGVPIRERDTLPSTGSIQAASEFPAYFPLEAPQPSRGRPPVRRPHRLPPEVWPEIQKRAKRESLRHLAEDYGVSHEAIRRIVNMKRTKRTSDRRRSA